MKAPKISDSKKPLEFSFGDDSFIFVANAPAEVLSDILLEYVEITQEGRVHDAYKYLLTRTLSEESMREFENRISTVDAGRTIPLTTMIEVTDWLVEEYGHFPVKTTFALVGWAIHSWHEFNGWAIATGVKLQSLPATDFMDLIYHYLTKDLDQEGKEQFEKKLETIQSEAQFSKAAQKSVTKTNTEAPTQTEAPKGRNKFRAPAGWTPPGWSEEAAYRNSVAAQKAITTKGGGKVGPIGK